MILNKKKLQISFLLLFFFCLCVQNLQAKDKFVLVIDAGHGGKDPGTKGKNITEKKITLAVALKLGTLIEKNHKDVKLVYTRKGDSYPSLKDRAEIANKNKANLFISIHANWAENKKVRGAETYTLGLSKSNSSLEVSMRENSVILLEDDYKTKYHGFNPKSTESYIMFDFIQDKFQEKSIDFASMVQHNFIQCCKRTDRGVRQARFWVLHQTACPSILIELGFLSNWEEEKFLSSAKNQQEMARGIYSAFVEYKKEFDKKNEIALHIEQDEQKKPEIKPIKEEVKRNTKDTPKEKEEKNKTEKPVQETLKENTVYYKIQIFASSKKLEANDKAFKGLKGGDYYVEGGVYKYTVGNTSNRNEILELKKEVNKKFKDAFVVEFKNGERLKK